MTDNARITAQTKINRQNADAYSTIDQIDRLVQEIDDKQRIANGGTDDAAAHAAVIEIVSQLVLLGERFDVLWPVVKYESTEVISIKVPVWGIIPPVSEPQDAVWPLDLNDHVEGAEPLTFSLSNGTLPAGIALDPNGTFAGTVTNAAGSGTFLATATNSFGATESFSTAWTIA